MPRTQHPLEIHGFEKMVEEGLDVSENAVADILKEVVAELKRLNRHLQILTDEEIEDNDY